MPIALGRNNTNPIQRSKFMQCVSIYESPEAKAIAGDRRLPVERKRKEDVESSSSSSSVGRNSDVSGGSSDGEDSNEVQSLFKGPLDTLESLEEVLPIKKGISKFYTGKSKSFTSLSDASSASSIKDLAKPENPYTRKRKNLLAHNNFLNKNRNLHFRSNGSGMSKKSANFGRSTLVLEVSINSSESITDENSNSISSSHSHHLPPLHPQVKRLPGNGSSSSPPRRNSPWRSFSLSDLQSVADSSPNVTVGRKFVVLKAVSCFDIMMLPIVLVAFRYSNLQRLFPMQPLPSTFPVVLAVLRLMVNSIEHGYCVPFSQYFCTCLITDAEAVWFVAADLSINELPENLAIWKMGLGAGLQHYHGSSLILLMLVGHREDFVAKAALPENNHLQATQLSQSFWWSSYTNTVQHMMPSLLPFVSQEEFKIFHEIDRELYTILAINLWRDPVDSMQIMALWLWLERTGFNNVVKKILSLPYTLINELADEAVICLNCINNDHSPCSSENNDIPLMQCLMEKEISLRFFYDNRLNAIQGVAKIASDVCIRAVTDIMQQAVERNASQSLADSQKMMAQSFQKSLVQPGFQVRFCPNEMVQSWTQQNEVPADDRTMFVTFSKGYPVLEREVREFFTSAYGDCIESLHMQEVQSTEQSLFARIVFHSASSINVILNGMGKAKFTINGKHVWARKFIPKRPKSLLTPPKPPSL
ncbi:hypothetical protein Patl1_13588 [Pistacia atlantica]|uniref:Uncharacterized protein n=1 Tax=Pistacia atlantica TaxID=434234 RepID=A0ACC1AUC5_9ROSI|nr:hypothetical protein Patl1_13588 [Pistacia atlantica]